MVNVHIPAALRCPRCRHTWRPRQVAVTICPRCKARLRREPKPVKLAGLELCFNCGHKWRPLKSPLVRCPKCKNRHWYLPQRPKRGRPPKVKEQE